VVTFTVPKPQPVLKPGTYEAVLTGIEQREKDGRAYLAWAFEAKTKTGTVTLKAASSTSFGQKSKARIWTEALLGRPLEAGETVAGDDLLGLPCLLVVGVKTRDDGSQFNSIENVLPKADEAEPGLQF
jgi:hypothetical protein